MPNAKRYLPYIQGGDLIMLMPGKKDNVFPTTSEITTAKTSGIVGLENIVNIMPNFFPNRDVLERNVLGSQQALASNGMRPRVDGTMNIYWDDELSLEAWEFMQEQQFGEASCFGILWYERVFNRTTFCLCTTDDEFPNATGTGGDEALVELPLLNDQEAISKMGNAFEPATP